MSHIAGDSSDSNEMYEVSDIIAIVIIQSIEGGSNEIKVYNHYIDQWDSLDEIIP